MGTPRAFEFGPFRLDVSRRLLTRDGEPITLAPKPISLLTHLIERPGQTLSKEELIRHLWTDSVGSEANLSVNIAAVRRALGERPRDHRYVVTVPMRGYSFVADVRAVGGPDPAGAASAETAPARPRRLAILPFQNPHSEPDEEHLGIGLADAITKRIPHLRGWAVQSAETVSRIVHDSDDSVSAGRELEVDAVMSGKIGRLAGGRTVSVQIMLVEDGSVWWGDTYTESDEGLVRLPGRIAEDLSRVLELAYRPQQAPTTARSTKDLAAFQEYLKGLFLVEKADKQSILGSIRHFRSAQEIDPEFSLPPARMAGAFYQLWRLGQIDSHTAASEMEAAARRALELDDTLAYPFFWLAYLNTVYHWNWPVARAMFQRGLQCAPNSGLGHTLHAYYLVLAGRDEEALAEARLGQDLEPTNAFAISGIGTVLRLSGHLDAAVTQSEAVTRLAPDYLWGHLLAAWTLLAAERYEQALAKFKDAQKRSGELPWVLAGKSFCNYRLGDPERAAASLDKLTKQAGVDHIDPYILAFAHFGVDQPATAILLLEEAYRDRNPILCYLRLEPVWSALRGDPGFEDLIDRIGAPAV